MSCRLLPVLIVLLFQPAISSALPTPTPINYSARLQSATANQLVFAIEKSGDYRHRLVARDRLTDATVSGLTFGLPWPVFIDRGFAVFAAPTGRSPNADSCPSSDIYLLHEKTGKVRCLTCGLGLPDRLRPAGISLWTSTIVINSSTEDCTASGHDDYASWTLSFDGTNLEPLRPHHVDSCRWSPNGRFFSYREIDDQRNEEDSNWLCKQVLHIYDRSSTNDSIIYSGTKVVDIPGRTDFLWRTDSGMVAVIIESVDLPRIAGNDCCNSAVFLYDSGGNQKAGPILYGQIRQPVFQREDSDISAFVVQEEFADKSWRVSWTDGSSIEELSPAK